MSTRITGFTTALTDIDTTAQEPLGAIRDDVNHTYKYVKFSGTTAVAAGDFVAYVTTDANYQTVDGAATILGAGVAVAAHASGSVTYGWMQIKGVAVTTTAITATLGYPLYLASANQLAVITAIESEPLVGYMAVATGGKTVLLDCPV